MAEAEEPPEIPEIPEGTFTGVFFLAVMALTALVVVVQLVLAKQYVIMGVATTVVAGLAIVFMYKASHSPRAGENNSEEKK